MMGPTVVCDTGHAKSRVSAGAGADLKVAATREWAELFEAQGKLKPASTKMRAAESPEGRSWVRVLNWQGYESTIESHVNE